MCADPSYGPMGAASVVEWLLEEEQPAVRYGTLRRLLGRPESDAEVRAARRAIPERGWGKEILACQEPDWLWAPGENRRLYTPKYLSTNWMLLTLADLGVPGDHPPVAKAIRTWKKKFAKSDGGFGMDESKSSHLCLVGNTARALIQFGLEDDPTVRSSMEWLVQHQSHLGGWSCFGSGRNLDSWEGLSAIAALPREKRSRELQDAADRAAEFFLSRELHRQGTRYEPWYRFHYPVHYYYDLLVGLDLLTSLGCSHDRRLGPALAHLKERRGSDGRWRLDAAHPDVEGPIAEWIRSHPKQAPIPFSLETVGEPSKMITLRAMTVLARVDGTAPAAR